MKKKERNGKQITLPSLRQNAILNAAGDSTAASIIEYGTLVHLALRQQIYDVKERIQEVYFPLDCVLSAIVRMRDGNEVEVGTIGREGMSAFPLLTGASTTANICYCQVQGSAVKLSTALFRDLIEADPAFRQLLDRYLRAYVNMLAQLAACNRLHPVRQRCARWLLMTRDRIDFDAIPLTQEFLAMMLGCSRSGVANAMSELQIEGVVNYTNGVINILDRPALESAACECYEIARAEFQELLQVSDPVAPRIFGPSPLGGSLV